MKNNDTFNKILNSTLASIDPGFGQFALAKAAAANAAAPILFFPIF